MLRLPGNPVLYAALALGWVGLIFYLSSQTRGTLHGWFPSWLHGHLSPGHIGLFGLLAVWWYLLAWSANWKPPFAWAVGLTAVIGVADELYQLREPTRTSSLTDWLYDVAGAILATWILHHLRKRRRVQIVT